MENNDNIGKLGEDIACRFLEQKGFKIIDRNYRKKWGEIDIVAKQGQKLHFVEVKSVSREIASNQKIAVTRENLFKENDLWQPEDAVHPKKITRMRRVIQSYLGDFRNQDISRETEWVFDIIALFIDPKTKIAKIRFRENVLI